MLEGKHISEASIDAKNLIIGRRDKTIMPIVTPWTKLNKVLMGGPEFGTLFTCAGVSSSGKTAFASQFYREVHNLNPFLDFIIVFFSFEMTAAKLLLRDAIAATKIRREIMLSANGNKINSQQEHSINEYYESIKNKPIYFLETPKSGEEYIKILEQYYSKYKKKIIAISDHSLLFKGTGNGDREMLVDLSKEIMIQKNEGWCMHMLLMQLNREIESAIRRTPNSPLNYPDKSCLTSSDSIFQASDYVYIIHRPHVLKFTGDTYGPDKLPTGIDNLYGHLIKNREGETAILKFKANFGEMKIENLD